MSYRILDIRSESLEVPIKSICRCRGVFGETSENIVSKDYIDFVNSVTSDPSKNQIDFVDV